MPCCAFTPAEKWCFTAVISVTRSAASTSAGLALRPVTTTCRSLRRALQRAATTLSEIEIVVAQRDVQLVEDDEADRRVGHQFLRLGPGALGGGDVARQVLRFPGEALAHRVPDDPVAEGGESILLAGVPGALDELHDADAACHSPACAAPDPKAAVDLPLPGPVLTISRPFSIVFSATSASCTALRLAILALWRSPSLSSIVMLISPASGGRRP